MRHPDDGLIEEYLDGELAGGAAAELEAHVAACGACGDRLEAARAARAEADELVDLLGEPEPRGGTNAPPPWLRTAPRRAIPWRTVAWAASLVVAAGLGYAGGARFDGGEAGRAVGQSDGRALGQSDGREVGSDVAASAAEPPSRRAAEPTASAAEPPSRRAVEPTTAPLGRAAEPPSRRAVEEASVRTGAASQGFQGRTEGVVALDAAQPPAKQRVDGALAPPLESALAERNAAAEPPSRRAAEPHTIDDAVRALGGSIRLLDGLEVSRVDLAWLPMPGGDSAAVVELTYADAAGHPIVLRQSRTPGAAGERGPANAFAGADRLERDRAPAAEAVRPAAKALADAQRAAAAKDGETSWTDPGGFRLLLRADADADSLARLRARVR